MTPHLVRDHRVTPVVVAIIVALALLLLGAPAASAASDAGGSLGRVVEVGETATRPADAAGDCYEKGIHSAKRPWKSGSTIHAWGRLECPRKVSRITVSVLIQQRRFGYWSTKRTSTINRYDVRAVAREAKWGCSGSGKQLYRTQSYATIWRNKTIVVGTFIRQPKNKWITC